MWELQGCSIVCSHQGQALVNTQQFAMESEGCSFWLLLPEGHRKGPRGVSKKNMTPYLLCLL